jgi:hypothetical protein
MHPVYRFALLRHQISLVVEELKPPLFGEDGFGDAARGGPDHETGG